MPGAEGGGSVKRAAIFVLALLVALWVLRRWAPLPATWADAWSAASGRALGLSIWQWALVAAGIAASYAFRVQRVYAEWSPRVGVRWGECLRVVAMHYALVNLLPMRSGEAGFGWLLWKRWRVPVASATVGLLRWRAQDAVVLLALAAVLMTPVSLPARAALVAALAGAAWIVVGRWNAFGAWLHRRAAAATGASSVVGRFENTLVRLADAIAEPGAGLTGWVCGIGNWAVKLATVGALMAWLAGLDGPAGLAGAAGGEIGAALPVQPLAGFGTYEAGVWAGVSTHAAAADAGSVLASALLVHLLFAASAIVIGAVGWLAGRELPQLKTAPATPAGRSAP